MRTIENKKATYINKFFAKESADLLRINAEHGEKLGMNISAYEGKFLQLLIKLTNTKTIVEIGSFHAYSTTWMAEALPDEGKIISIESNEDHYKKALENISKNKSKDKIDIQLGSAIDVLASLKGPFDMVFIDANKAGYIDYLNWAEKNIRKGGLIVGDNTFLFGHLTGEETPFKVSEKQKQVMQEFNERLADSDRYQSIMLPSNEGMTIAMKLY